MAAQVTAAEAGATRPTAGPRERPAAPGTEREEEDAEDRVLAGTGGGMKEEHEEDGEEEQAKAKAQEVSKALEEAAAGNRSCRGC